MKPLLEVDHLVVEYPLQRGMASWLQRKGARGLLAVNGVSLSIPKGHAVGVVGESGCGKSTLGRAMLGLEKASEGTVGFDAKALGRLSAGELTAFRRRAQMIFQDPVGALNPRLSVRQMLSEVIRVHRIRERADEEHYVKELAAKVGLSEDLLDRKPRSLSGGQCQRVGIARALATGAEFLVADEPTSALDVSVQAQIMNLFKRLKEELDLTLLFISHDLGVVRYLCDTVLVMYLGRIVERGPAERVFADPKHPYTRALMASIPHVGETTSDLPKPVKGEPPSPINPPTGCPFHPRCDRAFEDCKRAPFPEERVLENGTVACHLYSSQRPRPKGRGLR
ncbi:MAG TPA: ABC transporter ATP-binding protein [Gammaproteobacteria bacterium]|nr:ABC transporter ATP-binding protein [Gammaproteobacteria bacterium]